MFTLPEILFEERYAIGFIRHQIRQAQQVIVVSEQLINISPRIKQPLMVFNSGERIIVTSRKDVELPEGVDGILFENNGMFYWARHKHIDAFKFHREQVGSIKQAREIAATWKARFRFLSEQNEPGTVVSGGLRPPQLGALHAIGSHWSLEKTPATIVMPTGTGKTETMLATLAAYTHEPIFVVVPWDALRTQTANKFLTFGLLRAIGVLPNEVPNPIVGVMKKRPKSISDLQMFEHCNVVIATISTIGAGLPAPILDFLSTKCKALILDEAHHVAASTWALLKKAFKDVPTLQFTATPFRRDRQLVDGKVIFSYSLGAAQRDHYFKPIRFVPVQVNPFNADRVIV